MGNEYLALKKPHLSGLTELGEDANLSIFAVERERY